MNDHPTGSAHPLGDVNVTKKRYQTPIRKVPLRLAPLRYVLSGPESYKLMDVGSWETLARAHGADTWDLIYLKLQTRHPTEVKRHLCEYVCCRRAGTREPGSGLL